MTLDDIQIAILRRLCIGHETEITTTLGQLAAELKCDQDALVDALQVMQDRGRGEVVQYATSGHPRIFKSPERLSDFLYRRSDFRIRRLAQGRGWFEEQLREEQASGFRNLGVDRGNEIVKSIMGHLEPLLGSDSGLRTKTLRVLEGLVRIAIRNYQIADLRNRFQRFLSTQSETAIRHVETAFYQPFLHEALSHDDELAGQIAFGSSLGGGRPDLIVAQHIPIEAKVVYPGGEGDSQSTETGVAQAVQYSALSRFAFLSVLDTVERRTAANLSNLENDIKLIKRKQVVGTNEITVVRIRHIVGFGHPSNASDLPM